MAKPPQKPPLALVSGEIESYATPLRPLGHHGQRLWSSVMSEYGISDIGGREILTQICELLDRAERLRAAIDADGEIIRTKTGPKLHPAVREETSIRVAIQKIWSASVSTSNPSNPQADSRTQPAGRENADARYPTHAAQSQATNAAH